MTYVPASDFPAITETFQLSASMPRRRASEIEAALSTLWSLAVHSDTVDVGSDIETLRRLYFDPVAQGKRLREQLADVAPSVSPLDVPAPLFVSIGESQRLITPEGRAALELVRDALRESHGATVTLKLELACDLERLLLDAYREWSRHRLNQVVALLGDEGLRPPVVGLLLTMLANRSIGPSRAIKRYPEGPERDVIDEAFRRPAGAFAEAIDPRRGRSKNKERLVSGWTLHEVTRRYPAELVIDDGDRIGLVYIAPGAEQVLLDAAVRAMARKHVGVTTAGSAYDALVEQLRSQRQRLSGYAMFFERPAETATLREDMLDQLRRRLDENLDR